MRSPDAVVVRRAPLRPLLAKELRDIVSGRALWTMLLILCPLVGYSFFQAVALYGEASSAARDAPVLASGLSPLDGVLVPTFGALYLAVTLLFPFVAIRSLGREKETGALRLLVQLPYRVPTLIAAKMTAIFGAWLAALIPAVSAAGDLGRARRASLCPGNRSISLSATCSTACWSAPSRCLRPAFPKARRRRRSSPLPSRSAPGSWISPWPGNRACSSGLSRLSLTQTLRTFEQGLLSIGLLLGIVAAICGFAALAAVWLHPGVPLRTKLVRSIACVAAVAVVLALGHAGQDIGRPHRGSAQLVSCRRSAGAGRASRAAARSRFTWRRKTRATSICAATFWPSSSASLPRRHHSARHDRPKRRGQQQRRGLRRDRIFLCAAAPTRAARPARARSCRCSMRWREGRSRRRAPGRSTPATRLVADATARAAVVLRRPSAADRPRLVVEPPPATQSLPSSSKTEVNHEHDQEHDRDGCRLRRPRRIAV